MKPQAMDLFCPACGLRHVDQGEWATRPHKTHRCVDVIEESGCGHEWRPHDFPTVGRSKRDQFLARTGKGYKTDGLEGPSE